MEFSVSNFIAGFVFGVVGLFVFRQGKQILNYSMIFTGVALMIYPWFVSGPLLIWGVGLGLTGIAYYFHNHHNLTG